MFTSKSLEPSPCLIRHWLLLFPNILQSVGYSYVKHSSFIMILEVLHYKLWIGTRYRTTIWPSLFLCGFFAKALKTLDLAAECYQLSFLFFMWENCIERQKEKSLTNNNNIKKATSPNLWKFKIIWFRSYFQK